MARIRSIHPGFYTDERLVPTSAFARLLFLGLGIHADDKGIFEWKPITLKMKIFPADNIDINQILSELVSANAIRKYEINGREYGAIRNFRKYQKPKTPNDLHPITEEIRNYINQASDISEPFPQKGEINLQREEGGGRREEIIGVGEEEVEPVPLSENKNQAVRIIEALDNSILKHFGRSGARLAPSAIDLVTAQRWLDAGASVDACASVIDAVVMRQKATGKKPAGNLKYFENPIREALASSREFTPDLTAQKQKPLTTPPEIIGKLKKYHIFTDDTIRRWIDPCKIDESTIIAPSKFHADWIENKYHQQLLDVFGMKLKIEVKQQLEAAE